MWNLTSLLHFHSLILITCSIDCAYLSGKIFLKILSEVPGPVGDGRYDDPHRREYSGHDEEDDVALGGHEDTAAAKRQPRPVMGLLNGQHLNHRVGRVGALAAAVVVVTGTRRRHGEPRVAVCVD